MSYLCKSIQPFVGRLKPLRAFFLAFLTAFGVVPTSVLAQEPASNGNQDFAAVHDVSTLPDFIYFDDERLYLDDERILNVVPVLLSAGAFSEGAQPMTGTNQPTVTRVFGISGAFAAEPDVYMNTRRVSAQRYAVEIDGVLYEAFCADPQLPGPESSGAVYELTGPAATRYNTVLRYGFPTNPYFSQDGPNVSNADDRMWWAYVTRVAVAMANNTNHNFTGSQETLDYARALVNGTPFWVRNFDETKPAIMVNGARAAEDLYNVVDASVATAQSETFAVTYNRRNQNLQNRFRFEWCADTPAGAELVVNGNVIATAPANSTEVFWGDVSFHIQMPNTAAFQNREAKVYLVGIHNQYAGRVWLMQNPNNRDAWQDIVFYIPYMSASAVFYFEPTDVEGALRIVKRNPAGRGLAGAVFEITGPDGFHEQMTTPANGVILLVGLEPGEYTVTEIIPPPGHYLSEPTSRTVTIQPNSTAVVEVIFINPPKNGNGPPPGRTVEPPSVRIQKIDALSRENIPGALMRIEGRSAFNMTTADGQLWSINNTGIDMSIVLTEGHTLPVVPEQSVDEDGNPTGPPPVSFELEDGVLTIHNLPWGYYRVQEERAPDGYSLLPQHTAYSFWVLPPDVMISVAEGGGEGDADAEDGSIEAMINAILTGELSGPADGKEPCEDCDSGGVDFIIDEQENVNSILITFENYPFSEIVVYKRAINNGIEGDYLAGAVFRIEGFFVEGNAPQIIDMVGTTDASGRLVFRGLPAGNYTITELQAPAGFMRNYPHHRSVNVSWGQIDGHPTRPAPSIVFFNTPKSSLEIHKVCGTTGTSLAGAVFEISDPTTGESWQATTDASGRAIFGHGSLGNFLYPDRTYIVREVVAPQGFVLDSTPREIVLSPGDNNIITWTNYHNPALTIIKQDQDTGERLAGAHFTITALGGGNPLPTDFVMITDENGEIRIPWTLFPNEAERTFIVTETVPPPGYNLANPNWQQVTLRAGYDNTVVFANRRMPTLTIQKIDARTGYPIQGAWFEIEFLGATAGTGGGNIGPSGPLSGNPFITDSNGRIVIEGLYSGRYRIREVRAANNYWLDTQEANRTWIIEIRDNEDYLLVIENTLLPTLIITKRNAITWRPIPMTQFRVDFEQPNSPNVMHVGTFMTNQQGQIILPFVQVGWYRVTETRPAPGMTLATNNSFRVFLQPGDNSYALIREGIIASESMIIPSATPTPTPPTGDEPVFEPNEADEDREYLQSNSTISNAPTPDIPTDAEVEVIEPDVDAIVDERLAPETGNPSDSSAPSNPSASPNFDEDWFNDRDLEDMPIYHYDNPSLPSQANGRLDVWGGEVFWNNELEVWNFPQNTLVIRKENAVTGELLAGARFSVTRISSGDDSGMHGTVIGEWTTNHSGILVIAGLDPGFYIVEETQAPPNFTLSANTRQHVFMRPDDTSVVSLTFSNLPYGSMLITLRCSVTSAPIPNGEFRVTNSAGAVVGSANGIFWTNLQGEVLIPNVRPDSYIITQISVPPTHVISLVQSTQTILVNPTGQTYRVDFFSDPLSQLLITLRCEVTGQPIQGGEFRVTNSAGNVVGSANGIFFTNLQGEILIPSLGVDSYVVTQLNAPAGFRLGEQNSQTIFVQRPSETYALNFTNEPYSGLIIQNLDGYNGDPLPGVRFRIDRIDDSGNVLIGEHVTDNNGRIELTGLLGSFSITQLDVPNGWEFDAQPTRIAHVNTGTPTLVTFHSPRMGSLEITLADEDGNPLSGGRFEVRRQNGQLVGEFVTPVSGMVSVPNLGSGWFTVEQMATPQGFVMTDTGRSVEVSTNTVARANFVNIQQPSLVIEKVDTEGNPLAGAEFEVRTLAGTLIHRGATNNGGIISIARLDAGAFTIIETRAPQGFVITEPSRTITIVAGETLTERFVNIRAATLTIEKVDTDGNPLARAEFEVRLPNGELIARITTNNGGIATIDNIEAGTVIIEETRAPQGFVITEPARTVTITAGQNVVERFVNHRQPSLIIEKVDTDGNPLANAEFEVRTLGGQLVHRAVTNQGGLITIPYLAPGSYQVMETRAPEGFVVTEPARAIEIFAGQTLTERFVNHRMPALIIEKVDTDGNPLAGATFEVRTLAGLLVERIVTNQGGMAIIHELAPGSYEIIETIAPEGFALVEGSRAIQIIAGQTITERFINPRLATLVIQKVDGISNAPLQGVVFEVSTLAGDRLPNPSNNSFEFVTDAAGMIRLPNLAAGTWVITETRPLPGYMAAEPVVLAVSVDREYVITVRNYLYPDYNILKLDGNTGLPLAGVEFEIAHFFANGQIGSRIRNPFDGSFTWTTDAAGLIRIPNLKHGTYVAIETRPLPGFRLAEPRIFVVADHEPTTITINNYRYSEWNIRKLDGHTNQPQTGVVFEVAVFHGSGTMGDRLRNSVDGSFEFVTDSAGIARIGALEPGTFIITEIRPLAGFIAAEPVIITVTGEEVDTTVTIRNYRMGDISLLKVDGDTNRPLQGVVFEIHRQNGERVQNPANNMFEFVTDNAGRINMGFLAPGSYLAVEVRALDGFVLAAPVPFEVIEGRDLTVTVRNYRQAYLTIQKINSITRAPLEGVVFEISRPDGTRLVNPRTGNHDFITDARGLIFLPVIEDGRFYLRETRALPGFLIDEEIIAFTIDASARQREHLLVVENTPAAGLLIIARDAQTRRPLAGIEVEVRHADGRVVTGQLLHGNQPSTPANSPQLSASGNFVTDSHGRINLNHLAPGVYHVRVVNSLGGYQWDTDVHVVTVVAGQQTVLELESIPLGGFRLLHVDAITGAPIFNAEFMIFDHNNKVVGNWQTDNRGIIDFSAILTAGRYTIRLTRPAPGYSHDDMPRTVEFIAGRVTEIVWEAIPIGGQLQILKVSGDANQHNGLPAGTPLQGAIFEIFEARTGNLVDRIVSNERGMAVSRPLPLGRYIAREVAAPAFYMINPQEIHFDVEHENQIVRVTFPNFSANVGVTIRKTGPQEAMQGHNIVYEIPVIRNESSIPLADFFWRDTLPTNAVRIDRLVTGTYNHALRYRVLATTNRGNQIVVADNLSTLVNNVIELRPVHLGLAANEYIVDITLFFGQVPAGFTSVEHPRIFVDVLSDRQTFLPDGMMFANKVDVGGRIPGSDEWVIGNSTVATTIFNPRRIPQSGW